MTFKATSNGKDAYGLRDHLQQFADVYWLSDHVSDERGAEVILEAFKRRLLEKDLLDTSS